MNQPIQKKPDWGVSYGELVWREFFKSRLNAACLVFIVFLFVIAVLAPFLANDKPFVIRIDGRLHFPIFADLSASDYSVFLAAIVGLTQLLLIRRNRRKIEPSIRSEVLWRQVTISIAVILIGTVSAFILCREGLMPLIISR